MRCPLLHTLRTLFVAPNPGYRLANRQKTLLLKSFGFSTSRQQSRFAIYRQRWALRQRANALEICALGVMPGSRKTRQRTMKWMIGNTPQDQVVIDAAVRL